MKFGIGPGCRNKPMRQNNLRPWAIVLTPEENAHCKAVQQPIARLTRLQIETLGAALSGGVPSLAIVHATHPSGTGS